MINKNEGINLEYLNNNENLSEKTSDKHKYTEIFGQKSENDNIISEIERKQTQYKIDINLKVFKNNHYICRECKSFPLIKIIKD